VRRESEVRSASNSASVGKHGKFRPLWVPAANRCFLFQHGIGEVDTLLSAM